MASGISRDSYITIDIRPYPITNDKDDEQQTAISESVPIALKEQVVPSEKTSFAKKCEAFKENCKRYHPVFISIGLAPECIDLHKLNMYHQTLHIWRELITDYQNACPNTDKEKEEIEQILYETLLFVFDQGDWGIVLAPRLAELKMAEQKQLNLAFKLVDASSNKSKLPISIKWLDLGDNNRERLCRYIQEKGFKHLSKHIHEFNIKDEKKRLEIALQEIANSNQLKDPGVLQHLKNYALSSDNQKQVVEAYLAKKMSISKYIKPVFDDAGIDRQTRLLWAQKELANRPECFEIKAFRIREIDDRFELAKSFAQARKGKALNELFHFKLEDYHTYRVLLSILPYCSRQIAQMHNCFRLPNEYRFALAHEMARLGYSISKYIRNFELYEKQRETIALLLTQHNMGDVATHQTKYALTYPDWIQSLQESLKPLQELDIQAQNCNSLEDFTNVLQKIAELSKKTALPATLRSHLEKWIGNYLLHPTKEKSLALLEALNRNPSSFTPACIACVQAIIQLAFKDNSMCCEMEYRDIDEHRITFSRDWLESMAAQCRVNADTKIYKTCKLDPYARDEDYVLENQVKDFLGNDEAKKRFFLISDTQNKFGYFSVLYLEKSAAGPIQVFISNSCGADNRISFRIEKEINAILKDKSKEIYLLTELRQDDISNSALVCIADILAIADQTDFFTIVKAHVREKREIEGNKYHCVNIPLPQMMLFSQSPRIEDVLNEYPQATSKSLNQIPGVETQDLPIKEFFEHSSRYVQHEDREEYQYYRMGCMGCAELQNLSAAWIMGRLYESMVRQLPSENWTPVPETTKVASESNSLTGWLNASVKWMFGNSNS